MRKAQLARMQSWFDDYTRSYLTGDDHSDSPLILKIDHTARVCENIAQLARAIGVADDGRLNLAQAVGLCHDVGRFEQYRRFGTFNDSQSVNHAAMGIAVLKSEGMLSSLAAEERTILMDAVRFHNAPSLPRNRARQSMLFMRLIRDADKLDIWKVFADYFRHDSLPASAILQHLPDLPTWSASIVDALLERRMARFGDMRSLNDFKLLQLSWVFDLEFVETRILARQRGDLAAIADALPVDPHLAPAIGVAMERLNETDQAFSGR